MSAKSLPIATQQPAHAGRSPEPKGNYAFISLGCPKNTVDSERMLGKLAQDGYALQPDADGADVVVVNTCGFIEPARQESLAVIREMLALKEQGRVGAEPDGDRDDDDDRGGQQVAQHARHDVPGDHGARPQRHRAEAVDDPGLHVVRDVDGDR